MFWPILVEFRQDLFLNCVLKRITNYKTPALNGSKSTLKAEIPSEGSLTRISKNSTKCKETSIWKWQTKNSSKVGWHIYNSTFQQFRSQTGIIIILAIIVCSLATKGLSATLCACQNWWLLFTRHMYLCGKQKKSYLLAIVLPLGLNKHN